MSIVLKYLGAKVFITFEQSCVLDNNILLFYLFMLDY